MNRNPTLRATWGTTMLIAVALAVAATTFVAVAGAAEPPTGESPQTAVLLSVGPNPSHYGDTVTFAWTATGFPFGATCNDNRGWVVNGGLSGSFKKTAGFDFTSSFTWILTCDDGEFYARAQIDVKYLPGPARAGAAPAKAIG